MGHRLVLVIGSLLAAAPVAAAPPTTPQLLGGPRAFAILADRPAQVTISWRAVPGATRYRVSWVDKGAAVDSEVTGTTFERTELVPGRHGVAIVALDKDNHESAPAQLVIDVVAIAATPPGADAPEPPSHGAFAVGTRFSSPGTPCALDHGTPAAELRATSAGRHWLTCGPVGESIVIAPVRISTPDRAPLWRELETSLQVAVTSVAPVGDRLDVEAIGELDLGEAQRNEAGFDVPVTPRANATVVGLRVLTGELELGRVLIPLSDHVATPPPPPVEPQLAWFALDLGAFAGMFFPPSAGAAASHLGHPMATGDTLTWGGSFAGHVGLFPTRRVGLETQVAVIPTGYDTGGGTSTLVAERIQIAVRAVEDRRFGIRILLGGDVLTELATHNTSHRATDGGVHYGAAFTVEVRRNLSLRLEAMHLLTTSIEAGYASTFLVQLGVLTRFGRRDRW